MNMNDKNIKIKKHPGVFPVDIYPEGFYYAEKLKPVCVGKSILEIGTGSGVVSILLTPYVVSITATDTDPKAVENARYNFKNNNVQGEIIASNVFDGLPDSKKFEIIFWNHPFFDSRDTNEFVQSESIATHDIKYKYLKKYIEDGKRYLSSEGRLLLGTSNIANLDAIQEIATKNKYTLKTISEWNDVLTTTSRKKITYLIYELLPNN
jgi:release factor glutamine methyltransferase